MEIDPSFSPRACGVGKLGPNPEAGHAEGIPYFRVPFALAGDTRVNI